MVAALLVFFVVPLPLGRVRQIGLVQIDPPFIRKVTLSDDAILTALNVENGQAVKAGDQVAEFRSPKLEAELAAAQGQFELASKESERSAACCERRETRKSEKRWRGRLSKREQTNRPTKRRLTPWNFNSTGCAVAKA